MKLATILIVLSLLAFSGCAHSEFHPTISPSVSGKLPYPEQFTIYHRVILTVGRRNYDFNGYLARTDLQISAVGFNDLGGRLFHITSSPGKVEILTKPDHLPASILRKGVTPELNALFAPDLFHATPATASNDRIVLNTGPRSIEYIFGPGAHNCHTIIVTEKGKLVSQIELRDYHAFPGWNRELPRITRISNRKWNYEITLRLLQIKAS